MSWSVKIAGRREDVVNALRGFKDRHGLYPDTQRDAVLELAASQVANMNSDYYKGVVVEGSGHQGSNFAITISQAEIADAPGTADSPAPTSA
jgi:hypothetical protein